jgi:hypothetical protein
MPDAQRTVVFVLSFLAPPQFNNFDCGVLLVLAAIAGPVARALCRTAYPGARRKEKGIVW